MKDDFIAVLLVATLSCKTTIEHEFISVVLSLDGLQHPLLRGALLEPIPGTRKYEVSEADYEVARGRLIESQLALVAVTFIMTIVLAIFANAAGCLRTRVDAESQTYAELVVMMLSAMRDIYQVVVRSLLCFERSDMYLESTGQKAEYGEFCRRVFRMLSRHPELVSHPRMSDALGWGRKEWNFV